MTSGRIANVLVHRGGEQLKMNAFVKKQIEKYCWKKSKSVIPSKIVLFLTFKMQCSELPNCWYSSVIRYKSAVQIFDTFN